MTYIDVTGGQLEFTGGLQVGSATPLDWPYKPPEPPPWTADTRQAFAAIRSDGSVVTWGFQPVGETRGRGGRVGILD